MGRRLGQHFLNDPGILDRIVAALDPGPADVVVEIGAGSGSLTFRLVPHVGRVVAIETDRALVERLRRSVDRRIADDRSRVRLIAGDALALDWHALARDARGELAGERSDFKVVGNIPYAITTPLVAQALQPPLPALIVFLVQLDVADRLGARSGSKRYGALSVGVQAVAQVERLFAVRAGAFKPPPKVDSAVVRLTPLAEPLVTLAERAGFRRFLTALFSQRRKQLQRILRSLLDAEKLEIETLVTSLGLDPTLRPEVLEPHELVRLFRAAGH